MPIGTCWEPWFLNANWVFPIDAFFGFSPATVCGLVFFKSAFCFVKTGYQRATYVGFSFKKSGIFQVFQGFWAWRKRNP